MDEMNELTREKVLHALSMIEQAQDKRIKRIRLYTNYVQQTANAIKRVNWQAGDYIEGLLTKALQA